jgi:DnaJ-class molecular chaperone
VACSECTGDGFIEVERMPARTSYNDAPEPYCEAEPCDNCNGSGEVMADDVDFEE